MVVVLGLEIKQNQLLGTENLRIMPEEYIQLFSGSDESRISAGEKLIMLFGSQKIKDEASISKISKVSLRILKESKNSKLREEALWVLSAVQWESNEKNEEVINLLLKIAEDKKEDKNVRATACRVLGILSVKYDIITKEFISDSLVRIVNNTNENEIVRKEATWALGKVAEFVPLARKILINILKDKEENPVIRRIAAVRLGETKDSTLITLFLQLLKDKKEDLKVREGSAIALAAINTPTIVSSLEQIARENNLEPKIKETLDWTIKVIKCSNRLN